MTAPFHAGERAMQERAGMRERLDKLGPRVIRDYMPDQHRELFAALPFILVGSLDSRGRPWASILTGQPGFMSSPDPRALRIAAQAGFGDPLRDHLRRGAQLGLLGIELATRRRNRMNGVVTAVDDRGFDVHVIQSFGNCPQYIQARTSSFIADPSTAAASRPVLLEHATLSSASTALVCGADTFFIASGGAEGVDVSHRGGKPGFVRVTHHLDGTVLDAPDFRGNYFFNTLGNLALDPRAGLLFVDFGSGDVLMLTGEGEVLWDGVEVQSFDGAERLLRFRVKEGIRISAALPLRWSPPQQAPQLEAAGSW